MEGLLHGKQEPVGSTPINGSMELKRYELWEEYDENGRICSHTFFPEDNESVRKLLEPDAKLVKEIWASSWEDACKQEHEFFGWKPYVPMKT